MPVSIKDEDRGDYLLFEVDGSKNLEDGLAIWKEISRITSENGCNKILVVENIADSIYGIEIVEIVSRFRALGLAKVKIAYIDLKKTSVSDLELGALVANNQGINGRLFHDQDEAIAWLRAP